MAGKSLTTATLFAQKKLLNKAQTSVLKSDAQEVIGSNIQPAAATTFGQKIPTSPARTLYLMQSGSLGDPATVEYVQFNIESISGTSYDANSVDTGAGPEPSTTGPHGYKLILTGNYESLSPNPKKGNGIFDNGMDVYTTIGGLQIIPPVFSNDSPNPYTIKLYKGDPTDPTQEIPLESEIDWQLDTFNGILFVQDYDSSNVPLFARAFIYVGDMIDAVITNTAGGDAAAEYLVLTPTGSLTNERAFTPGTGLSGTDGGAGNAYTVKVLDSVFAALTGSVFSGTVSAPALSGSLTKLQDGSSYLIAGSNTTIVTGSSGAITISSTGGIDGSGAANRIATWSDSDTLTSDADFTWNGSLLDVQGDVNLNGTVVVNQSGVDKNFRVETQNKSSALQVDGETDQVLLFSGSLSDTSGHGSSAADPDPRAFSDTNFFVSGSIDSRDTSRRGTSVFGGDVVVSGTLSVNRGQAGVGSMFTITSDGKVGIGSDTPSYKLSVGGNMDVGEYIYHKNDANTFIRFQPDDINIQAGGVDLIRMTESGANTQVLILSGGATADPDPASFSDTSFFVSGSIGSIGTSSGGSSVFGGDVLASGSLVVKNGITGSLTQLSDGTSYLRAGSNITITSGSNGSVSIASSAAGDNRSKDVYFISSDVDPGDAVSVSSSDFSSASYDPDKIDIFLNGQLVHSGSVAQVNAGSRDYYVSSATSLKFSFRVQIDDILDVIVFSAS